MFKKVSFIALLSLIFASTLFGQEVSLEIPKANFSVGELVSLQLKVESEHSFQSLSFDLEYSGDLLTYVGYEYDGLTNDDDVKLLFAQAESTLDQKKAPGLFYYLARRNSCLSKVQCTQRQVSRPGAF
jgi:hypothetical protein